MIIERECLAMRATRAAATLDMLASGQFMALTDRKCVLSCVADLLREIAVAHVGQNAELDHVYAQIDELHAALVEARAPWWRSLLARFMADFGAVVEGGKERSA